MIIALFIIQLFLTLICAVFKILIEGEKGKKFDSFVLGLESEEYKIDIFEILIRYFILLNTFIPISLIVGLELIRLMQAYLIFENLDLKSKQLNRKCKVSTTTINEELGEIEYVLTDKTGTLTQNKMILRGVIVADKLFGGEFSIEDSGEKQFKPKTKTGLDSELDKYLIGTNQQILPYPMDVSNFKLGVKLTKAI